VDTLCSNCKVTYIKAEFPSRYFTNTLAKSMYSKHLAEGANPHLLVGAHSQG